MAGAQSVLAKCKLIGPCVNQGRPSQAMDTHGLFEPLLSCSNRAGKPNLRLTLDLWNALLLLKADRLGRCIGRA